MTRDKMYKEFTVENFRGFEKLELRDLARVNLIAGKNNVGKTALLEALFMYTNPYRPDLALNVYIFRGIRHFSVETGQWADHPLSSLFSDYDFTKSIVLSGKTQQFGEWKLSVRTITEAQELESIGAYGQAVLSDENGSQSSITTNQVLCFEANVNGELSKHYLIVSPYENAPKIIPIPPTPEFQGVFMPARTKTPFELDFKRFTQIKNRGHYPLLLQVLKQVEPRLNNLEFLQFGGESILHGDIGSSRSIPLPLMGDGISRLSSLVLAMVDAPNGILLIDEIENGLHYSVLSDVWRTLSNAADKMNVQIFATTHSFEMIQAAHKAFSQSADYDFAFHRLYRSQKTGRIDIVTYQQDNILSALEMNLEMR